MSIQANHPLIKDFSVNTFENPEKKAEIDEQKLEDELLRKNAEWNTDTMNDRFMEGFNMKKFDESDKDRLLEIQRLEAEDNDDWEWLLINNHSEQNQAKENEEKLLIFRENTQAPLIESLLNQWHISSLEFASIVEEVNWSSKEDINKFILSIANNIQDKDTRDEITRHLEWDKEQIVLENFENSDFYWDSNELGIDLDIWIWWLELMLANEFYRLPNSEWISDQSGDMLRTMDTVSKIIVNKNNSDFRRNNSDLIREIWEETMPSKKYSMLKKLFKEDLLTDAKFWGKKAKNEIAMKQKSIKEKAKLNTESIEQLATLQDTQESNKDKQKLIEDRNELIIAAQNLDHFEWEVFSWNMKIEWENIWNESAWENT